MQEPLNLDPTEYGWFKDEVTKSLQLIMLPLTKLPVPDYMLLVFICTTMSFK